jgi:hypothetical protein
MLVSYELQDKNQGSSVGQLKKTLTLLIKNKKNV